jgi:Raf kinase inhibitor-like YbhB/YbcL family protein
MANRQDPHASGRSAPVALHHAATRTTVTMGVSSPDFDRGDEIPARHTDYGEGRSPALRWKAVRGARSYAVLVEDPDAPTDQPFVHWLAWNIPPDTHVLPGDIRDDGASQKPDQMREGRNDHGGIGWFGPRPPAGDPPHRYHFQVFALDAMLDLADGATREDLLATIDGRVLAKGELVATSAAPQRH